MSAIRTKLVDSFNQETPQLFWHYLAKNCHDERLYQDQKSIEGRIQQIINKQGNCDFNHQSIYGWTPMHVAVLCDNRPAIRFFLEKGAKTDIKDEEGHDIYYYAKQNSELFRLISNLREAENLSVHNNLKRNLPNDESAAVLRDKKEENRSDQATTDHAAKKCRVENPHEDFDASIRGNLLSPRSGNYFQQLLAWLPNSLLAPQSKVVEILQKILPRPIALPSTTFTYDKDTDDFGREIKELLFHTKPILTSGLAADAIVFHIHEEIQQIALKEGFQFTSTQKGFYPRDSLIRGPDKFMTGWASHEFLKTGLASAKSKAGYFAESAMFATRSCVFVGSTEPTIAEMNRATEEIKRYFPTLIDLPFYMEGGNLFTLTNSKGQKKVLIGQNHLAQIHSQLERGDKFPASIYQENQGQSLSREQILSLTEEMFCMGLFSEGFSGFLYGDDFDKNYLEFYHSNLSFRDAALKKRLIPHFQLSREGIEDERINAAKHQAQKDYILREIAAIFKVSMEDVVFLPQIAYHLDVFLCPGPKGSIFLQDFDACIDVLERLKDIQTFSAINLSMQDRLMILKYLHVAKKMKQDLQPLMDKTRTTLEKAGFIVIPTPGVFYDVHLFIEDKTCHMNFLNAITGWSGKENHHFYITTGAQAGSHLGSIFMLFFESFLKQYDVNLKVYFVGENPKVLGDFSPAMGLWNQVQNNLETVPGPQSGVHCMSFEKEVASHTHP